MAHKEGEEERKEDSTVSWEALAMKVQSGVPSAEEAAERAAAAGQSQLAAEKAKREPAMRLAEKLAAQILLTFMAQQPSLLAESKDQFHTNIDLPDCTPKQHKKLVVTLISHFVTSALWRKGYHVDFNQHHNPPSLSVRWQKTGSIHPSDGDRRLECGCWPSDHREGVWSKKNHSITYIQSEVAESWLLDDDNEEDVGRKSQQLIAFEAEWHDKLCCPLRHGANPVAPVDKK